MDLHISTDNEIFRLPGAKVASVYETIRVMNKSHYE